MRTARNRRAGLALIVVVGMLGVLAAVAVAFVAMAGLERRASAQRTQSVKAFLLARGGLEDAMARLESGQDPEAAASRYGGEDWNGNGLQDGLEVSEQSYRGGAFDVEGCPVRQALRPSFFVRDPLSASRNPLLRRAEGRLRGYSGALSGDQVRDGNQYALRAVRRGGIHVNGGDPFAPSDAGYNAVLRRILETLAEALDREDGSDDGIPVDGTDGRRLMDLRPPGGWVTLSQIRTQALGGSLDKAEALGPYLALEAWVDRRVIAPNADAATANLDYHSWGEIKLAHALVAGSRAPGFERIGPRTVGRAPVDLAWARGRRPALIALMAGLKGLYLDESTRSSWNFGDRIGTLREAEIGNAWDPADDCHVAAQAVLASSGALATWQDFNALCDSIAFTGTSDLPQAKRDLLKANFNPNSDLNKFGPTPTLFKHVDKSDLTAYSTEFSLFPVQGMEVWSVGRVLDRAGRILASRTLRASLPSSSVVRLSTQREFVCGDLGSLDEAGDETDPRLPGQAPFLSLSRGNSRTWGHTLSGLGGTGIALQSYPEPCAGSPLSMRPADYDGRLELATVETPANAFYTVVAATRDMKMLARFDDGFGLDLADNTANSGCRADTLQVTASEIANSLLDASKPNTLYPDGAYGEKDRSPGFYDRGNSHGYHGVISYWVKRNYQDLDVNRWHVQVSRTNATQIPRPGTQSRNQLWCIGDLAEQPRLIFENGHNVENGALGGTGDTSKHHVFDPLKIWWPRRWYLVTAFWDVCGNDRNLLGEVRLDDGNPRFGCLYNDGGGNVNLFTQVSDLTVNDATGAHLMSLGWLNPKDSYTELFGYRPGQGADATFDELALYDFGGAPLGGGAIPGDAIGSVATVATNRYREGRFYKGDVYNPAWSASVLDEAGSWVSAPIALPPGARLQGIHWTWYRPSSLADDYAEVELLEAALAGYLWGDPAQARSTLARGAGAGVQSWPVRREPPGAFRARVVFRRQTPVGINAPILDSPAFDDLSFVYSRRGARPFSWTEEP